MFIWMMIFLLFVHPDGIRTKGWSKMAAELKYFGIWLKIADFESNLI
jgi:hypothetical protein